MSCCANCGDNIPFELMGQYTDFSGGVHYGPIHNFCSSYCRSEWLKQERQRQAFEEQQEALRQQMLAEERRQQRAREEQEQRERAQREEQARKEREQREKEETEKIRREHFGLCAWCGRQNEQVYMNQLLFPGKKFCSKKCLFDNKNAENPSADSAAPCITDKESGNVYTSVIDAFEWSKNCDALVFTNCV